MLVDSFRGKMARYILWHKKKHHTLIQLFVAPCNLRKIGLQENSELSDNEKEDRSTHIINKQINIQIITLTFVVISSRYTWADYKTTS